MIIAGMEPQNSPFAIANILEGKYEAIVSKDGFISKRIEFEILPLKKTIVPTVVLEPVGNSISEN